MALDFDKVNSYSRGLKEKTQPRDNTRINSKLEPRLKKKEEKELPDNRTYLSQAPSKDIREANNLNHTLKQIQDFGDKLKQVGLDLRDYAAVGTSMLNPAAGMVLGLGDAGISAAKGDYVSGGVQAGLEMLPYGGPLIKKGAKSGIKTYGTKAANLMEDITPRWSEKFHTWNAKDNINNMTAEQVINNKKSRLKAIKPDYSKDWDRVKSDPLNDEWEAERIINRDFPPENVRNKKIDNAGKLSEIETLETIINTFPSAEKIYNNPNITTDTKLNAILRNIYYSFKQGDNIHVGDMLIDPDFNFHKAKPFNIGTTYSHELDHLSGIPTESEYNKILDILNLKKVGYLSKELNHGTETKARLGQIKDLFNLKGRQNISKSQLNAGINIYRNPSKYGLVDNMSGLEIHLNPNNKPYPKDFLKNLRDFMNATSLKHGGKLRTNI